jgi:hypothetical protein
MHKVYGEYEDLDGRDAPMADMLGFWPLASVAWDVIPESRMKDLWAANTHVGRPGCARTCGKMHIGWHSGSFDRA